MTPPRNERELAGIAAALGGAATKITQGESQLVANAVVPAKDVLPGIRAAIQDGCDPLGELFCTLRSPERRREAGAVYTPAAIVGVMISWGASQGEPARVIDPGAGSGRFILTAGRRFPKAALVAIETDPLAALLIRANAAVLQIAGRLTVLVEDYRRVPLPTVKGSTLFVGNPPYVRHHGIPEPWKHWFAQTAASYGLKASKLAGLHIHFFLRTLQLARLGDFGIFITSGEWLDVNYGDVLRKLLADGLGGVALHVLDPAAMPFADAATTGAITCFRVGNRAEALRVRAVASAGELGDLEAGQPVGWQTIEKVHRWSTIIRPASKPPTGFIELGELCRVHRGQVTGANQVWIASDRSRGIPARYLMPTVTKARDLFQAGEALANSRVLRRVIDLPVDLDEVDPAELPKVKAFLNWAKEYGAAEGYIARNRRAWWSVGLKEPAPVICTYMARRPPAFVRNLCGARHLNIAHGLYPRVPLPELALRRLLAYLRGNVGIDAGRTYAGGLTKFEPKELERILVPALDSLQDESATHMDQRTAYG